MKLLMQSYKQALGLYEVSVLVFHIEASRGKLYLQMVSLEHQSPRDAFPKVTVME